MISYLLQIGLNSLVEVVQVALIATGFLLIYNVTKIVNMGLGAAFVCGAYAYFVGLQAGGSFEAFLAFACSLPILAWINVKLLQPFIEKGLDLMGLLVSISFWFAIQEGAVLIFGAQGRFLVEGVLPTVHWGEFVLPWTSVWTLIIGLVFVVVAMIVFLKLPLGRAIRATKQHPPAAAQLGIKERRLRMGAFMFAVFTAGLVGVLTGMNEAITPMSSHPVIVPAFLAFLVAGGRDIRAVFLAAIVLVLGSSFVLALFVSDTWREVIIFLIAAVILLLRPQGILSVRTRVA